MNDFRVYNAGWPGDTTVELLERFDRDVAARLPDLVCLLVGSNDMLYPGHMLDLATFRANLEVLLDRIAETGAKTIMFTAPRFLQSLLIENFPDTIKHPLSTLERLERLNDTIREIAAMRGNVLVDLYKLIDPVDESANSLILNVANSGRRDGMHFTAVGCAVTAEAVYKICAKRYPQAHSIVCFGDSLTYGVYMKGKGTADPDADTYPGQLYKLLVNQD